MKFLKLLYLWVVFPTLFFKHQFRVLFKTSKYRNTKQGSYMIVKEQRGFLQKMRREIQNGEQKPCLTTMLKMQALGVIATDPEDLDDLKKELRGLIGLAATWYALSDSLHKERLSKERAAVAESAAEE